ncbi:MAG: hypothetical protein KAY32_07050 [Candidatus Eisenbacteria sp.]|nr:hypothetical protein [Candidatus Eisenbacteria bacterium]
MRREQTLTRGLLLTVILLLAVVGSPMGHPMGQPRNVQQYVPEGDRWDLPALPPAPTRADTVWFGGYNEAEGIAYNSVDDGCEAAVWTWDAGTADSLEGWTSRDMSTNLRVYFARVTADSFMLYNDPVIPMFPAPNIGQLWVGAHEYEAEELGWILGMGYGNDWCQKAISPGFLIAPGHDIDISFTYFQDSEIDFDYTYVEVLCFEGGKLTETHEVQRLHACIGAPAAPALFSEIVAYDQLGVSPDSIQLQFRFTSDRGWSDEDGDYSCEAGPFAADDMLIRIDKIEHFFDFERDAQGWTFEKCPGVGSYMGIYSESEWSALAYFHLNPVACPCDLSGNALHCATTIPISRRPGHPRDQHECVISPIVDRGRFTSSAGWRRVLLQYDAFEYLRLLRWTFYRIGCSYYPHSTPECPGLRWSHRIGEETWHYGEWDPVCIDDRLFDLSAVTDGTPPPADWELLRGCIEVMVDCDDFGLWPLQCEHEGATRGSPVYDNVRLGLTSGPDAPAIALKAGHLFHDGFGQQSPTHLDPSDVCDVNIGYDLSRDAPSLNDWQGDTAVISGPPVFSPDQTYWIDLCFKVAKKGPRQETIPGYSAWKSRLVGSPEDDFVCALMDTAMIYSYHDGGWVPVDDSQARVTYFHEDDPGFNPTFDDRMPEQEILPDRVFTPGTRIEYYYRSYWAQGGSDYCTIPATGALEIEFLPMMEADASTPDEYDVIWPCVLYIDAFNAGAESTIMAMLEQSGLAFDKYDREYVTTNYDAPLLRSYGGDYFNPGGYGNNGCTLQQLLGYRLILFSSGTYGVGAGAMADFDLLESWLTTTVCGLTGIRRGLILNGDAIVGMMCDPEEGLAVPFCTELLGATITDPIYRDYNNDDFGCVYLSPSGEGEFAPMVPVAVYGNDCPAILDYDVLEVTPGGGAVGNLLYEPGSGAVGPTFPEIAFAQVVRESLAGAGDVGGWKSIVDGFSFHHLSQVGYGGEECSADSAAVLAGAQALFEAELLWLTDGGAEPFVPWLYLCGSSEVEEPHETHLAGGVDFLYPARPNPFRGDVAIRFSCANQGPVRVSVFDVSGRLVRTVHDGKVSQGETRLVWDGADNAGRRMDCGVYWVEMSTSGYKSSKELVFLK